MSTSLTHFRYPPGSTCISPALPWATTNAATVCQVGVDVYPLKWFIDDVAYCEIPRRIQRRELVSAVILKDHVLWVALSHPATPLNRCVVGIIQPGDVNEVEPLTMLHGALSRYQPFDFVNLLSLEHFSGLADEFEPSKVAILPRFQVCLMTQIARYAVHLSPWIDYHRRMGVDMIYLFDNHADEDLARKFGTRNDVIVIYWPWAMSQTQAFTYFLSMSKPRCEWTLYADVDEYVMLGLQEYDFSPSEPKPLPKYITAVRPRGYPQIMFRYIIMQNSGHRLRPKGLIPVTYTHRASNQHYKSGKSVGETDFDWVLAKVHACVPLQTHHHQPNALLSINEKKMMEARFKLLRYKGSYPTLP